eukprot:8391764-Lingulodinium_polyedra.AAC.1
MRGDPEAAGGQRRTGSEAERDAMVGAFAELLAGQVPDDAARKATEVLRSSLGAAAGSVGPDPKKHKQG